MEENSAVETISNEESACIPEEVQTLHHGCELCSQATRARSF